MKLYRVQRNSNDGSLWYQGDGTKSHVVDRLSNDRLAKMPMDFDPKYRNQNKIWQCATWSVEHFNQWFTLADFRELKAMGFVVIKFDCKEWIMEENQVLFTMQSASNIEDITDEVEEMRR